KPPKNAQKAVNLWRQWIEERAAGELDDLHLVVENQRTFAIAARKLLTALEVIDGGSLDNDLEDELSADDPQTGERDEKGSDGAGGTADTARAEPADAAPETGRQKELEAADSPAGVFTPEMEPEMAAEPGDLRWAAQSHAARFEISNRDYSVY